RRHGHRVIVGPASHLLLECDREGFFGEGFHAKEARILSCEVRATDGFLSKNGLSAAARLCLNAPPKITEGEADEKPLADPRRAARGRRLRHAGSAQARACARASTEAASHTGSETGARGKARAQEAGARQSLVARALRVQ